MYERGILEQKEIASNIFRKLILSSYNLMPNSYGLSLAIHQQHHIDIQPEHGTTLYDWGRLDRSCLGEITPEGNISFQKAG